MKSSLLLIEMFVAVVLLGSLASAAIPQPPDNKSAVDTVISPRDRALIVSKIYAGVQMYFGHFSVIPDYDLSKEYDQFLDDAYAAKDRYAFDLVCLAFIAKLKNSHSNFNDRWLANYNGESLGFRAGFYEDKWVVNYSRIPELKVGDVLSAIDGQSFEAFYQTKKRYISASSERESRNGFLNDRYLFPAQFRLEKGDGTTVTIKRIPFISVDRKTEGRWLTPNQVAYIKVPAFDPAVFEEDALKLVETFKDAKNLILDLRGNGGGSTPTKLIDALMDRPYRGASWSTPQHVAAFKVWGAYFDELEKDPKTPHDETYGTFSTLRDLGTGVYFSPSTWTKPNKPLFKGRLFILIDRNVYSAGEDCCIPFKDNHRATFIGEASGGSTGQPYSVSFPNGMSFRVSSKRDSFPDGSPFEGIGILPDIEVPTTISLLRSGKDAALEKAVALAQ